MARSRPPANLRRRYPLASRTMSTLGSPTWAIGITTAPRRDPSLDACLKSIVACGWSDNVYIFAEPGSERPASHSGNITWLDNERKRGCWGNWLYSAKWMLANTSANVIMTVQDDALFHPDSKRFVEARLWPSDTTGFISLYTPKHYSSKTGGLHKVTTSSLWGTIAVVWPRHVLGAVVSHKFALNFQGIHHASRTVMQRRAADPSLVNNADYAIGKVVNALRLQMWYITPSPVSHVAIFSSIKHGKNTGRRNCRPCANHAIPLEQQVGKSIDVGRIPQRLIDRQKAMRLTRRPGVFTLAPKVPRHRQLQRTLERLRKADHYAR